MFEVKLNSIKLNLFIGIAEAEKIKRNRIVLDIFYTEKERGIVDYSLVFNSAVKTAKSKRWLLLEDFVKSIHSKIKHDNSKIVNLRVSAKKLCPAGMKECESAEVSYGH
jgi:dihydroneopterin aldolase